MRHKPIDLGFSEGTVLYLTDGIVELPLWVAGWASAPYSLESCKVNPEPQTIPVTKHLGFILHYPSHRGGSNFRNHYKPQTWGQVIRVIIPL